MRIILNTVSIFICLTCLTASAGDYMPLDPKKSYLDINLEKGPFHMSFFRSGNPKGKSEVEVDEKGLSVGGKRVCTWPNNTFDPKNSANMVLFQDKSKTSCREVPAIRSTWGDGGTGTAVLTIEIVNVNEKGATIPYKGSQLFLSLENLKGRFVIRHPGEISNRTGD